MKTYTIPSNFQAYASPIWPYLSDRTWLAGGSIVRFMEHTLTPALVGGDLSEGDWDLFTMDPLVVRGQLIEGGYEEVRDSQWAWTLMNSSKTSKEVQVVKIPYVSPQEVLNGFDFTVRQWITDGLKMWMGDRTLSDVYQREIRFHNPIGNSISDAVSSFYGLAKYANRGYTLNHGEARKFLERYHEQTIPTEVQPY